MGRQIKIDLNHGDEVLVSYRPLLRLDGGIRVRMRTDGEKILTETEVFLDQIDREQWPIEKLGFSERINTCLKSAAIDTVGKLLETDYTFWNTWAQNGLSSAKFHRDMKEIDRVLLTYNMFRGMNYDGDSEADPPEEL